jgi:hypothetical protein
MHVSIMIKLIAIGGAKFKNNKLIGILPIMLISVSLWGQEKFTQKFGTEADHKRLYFLNQQYIQSWVKSDTATYNSLLWADDFVHQNSSDGLLYPKKEIAEIFGKPRFDKIDYFYTENVTIRFISDDAAMIFARTPFQAVGESNEQTSQYNDIYVRRKGKWECVSASVTPIRKPGDPFPVFNKLPDSVRLTSFREGTAIDIAILKQLNEKHAEAFLRSKSDLAENILAEDFILLAANGLLYTKQDVLTQIRNSVSENNVESYTIENLTIRFVAEDISLIHAAIITKRKDGRVTGLQYTDVYIKRDNRWICVSGNNTPIRN